MTTIEERTRGLAEAIAAITPSFDDIGWAAIAEACTPTGSVVAIVSDTPT